MSALVVIILSGAAGLLCLLRASFWARKVSWRRLWKYEPRARGAQVDCAWCGETLRAGCQPVSHGICDTCRTALIDGGAPEPDRVQHN